MAGMSESGFWAGEGLAVSPAPQAPFLLTNVRGQLLGGVRAELRDLQDDLAVRLHSGPGKRAQPIVRHVVQLGHLIAWEKEEHKR